MQGQREPHMQKLYSQYMLYGILEMVPNAAARLQQAVPSKAPRCS